MNKPRRIFWGGLPFTVCESEDLWNDVPGVYVFAGLSPDTRWWYAKYIGSTSSFKSRMPNHEKWEEAVRIGAFQIHALVVPDPSERATVESALIMTYKPPLNIQVPSPSS